MARPSDQKRGWRLLHGPFQPLPLGDRCHTAHQGLLTLFRLFGLTL
jgi:hypothetical protein